MNSNICGLPKTTPKDTIPEACSLGNAKNANASIKEMPESFTNKFRRRAKCNLPI